MLAVTRRDTIKAMIFEKKSVVVTDLAKHFNVSEETIRRDLSVLEKECILTRTYGGAFIQSGVLNTISSNIRQGYMVEHKEIIASLALENISNGDSIFIDNSTTSLCLAKKLNNMRIVVTTDSLNVANVLCEFPQIKLYLIGGEFQKDSMSFSGAPASTNLSRYFFDKCFVSCRSITVDHGITDSNEYQAELRSLAILHSTQAFLLCDHSKFDRDSFSKICDFNDIYALITNKQPNSYWIDFLASQDVKLYY